MVPCKGDGTGAAPGGVSICRGGGAAGPGSGASAAGAGGSLAAVSDNSPAAVSGGSLAGSEAAGGHGSLGGRVIRDNELAQVIVHEAGVEGGVPEGRVPQETLQKGYVHRRAGHVELRQGALQPADGALEIPRPVAGDELGEQRVAKPPAGRVAGVAERCRPGCRVHWQG